MATQTEIQYISDATGHPVSVIVPIAVWQAIESREPVTENGALQAKFEALAQQWRRETATFSSTSQIVMHPAYQRIMAMGEKVVPLILRELQKAPEPWFYALRHITDAAPVSPADAGDTQAMAAAWVKWGQEHGYLP